MKNKIFRKFTLKAIRKVLENSILPWAIFCVGYYCHQSGGYWLSYVAGALVVIIVSVGNSADDVKNKAMEVIIAEQKKAIAYYGKIIEKQEEVLEGRVKLNDQQQDMIRDQAELISGLSGETEQ